MSSELSFKRENVQIIERAVGWKEAILLSVKPLVENGYVESRYGNEIIKNVEKMGAYFLIAPGIAMPHARPEQGVIETQIGLTLFQEPVHFQGKSNEAKLFIVLAAADNENHMNAMSAIANAISTESRIQNLCEAENEEVLYQMFQGGK